MEQNSNQQPAANSQQIVNTEAAKAKANELVGKAKKGVEYYKNNIKTDKKLWIGTAVVALVVVLLLVSLMGGSGKSVAKKYANAMVKGDAEAMVKIHHEDYLDALEDSCDGDADECYEEMFEEYEDAEIEFKGYEITDVKDDYDKDDIEDMAEALNELYDIDEDSVKNVVRYTIKFEVEVDGDDDTHKVKVNAVKIGGKWYMFDTGYEFWELTY